MTQPPGFESFDKSLVYKLNKAIYRLKLKPLYSSLGNLKALFVRKLVQLLFVYMNLF